MTDFNDQESLASFLGVNLEIDSGDFPLEIRCNIAMKKPLCDLSVEDVRLLISQEIGLSILIPIAIRFLEEDVFCEGDFYRGDLLAAVLRIPQEAWNDLPNEKECLRNLQGRFLVGVENGEGIVNSRWREELESLFMRLE